MWDVWQIRDMHTGNVKETDHLEDPSVDGGIILKWVLKDSMDSINMLQ